jgi:signal transduction histidine kinase
MSASTPEITRMASRAKADYSAQITAICSLDTPGSLEFLSRIFLVPLPILSGILIFDMYYLIGWYTAYLLAICVEQYLFHRARGRSEFRFYAAILATCFTYACIVASLAVYLWHQDLLMLKFAAMVTITASMLRSVLQRSIDWPMLICDATPICFAMLIICASFWWLHQDTEAAIASAIGALCLSIYFFVAVRQHAQERKRSMEIQEALFQARQTETIGHLAGGMAHDFNNLLTVTVGNLEMYGKTADPAERDTLIRDAFIAAQRGGTLTRQLLSYARRTPLNAQPNDPIDVVLPLQDLAMRLMPSNIRVSTSLPAGLPPVLLDAAQMENAALNLILNARDAMQSGGTLTLSAKATTIKSQPAVSISIQDTGAGMSKEDVLTSVLPFHSSKPRHKGSGLGLSSVKGFVEQSEGTLDITSKLGVGTTVTMTFPTA